MDRRTVSDRRLLYAAAFLRALATGMIGVLIGIDLARRGFDSAEIGLVVGVGLAGAALAALVVTLVGDRLGRRRALVAVTILGGAGGLGVALGSELGVVVGAAFVGMVNGMGRDRAAALIIDQAILPATAGHNERTKAFAWYNVLQDVGHAFGGLLAGAPALLRRFAAVDEIAAGRVSLMLYSCILLVTAACYARLSAASEVPANMKKRLRVAAETRRTLWKISVLFAVDSLAGGFLTAALLSFFFF